MTTTVGNLPEGTTATDYWFDSAVANGAFPENRDFASFSIGDKPLENCIGYQLLGVTVPCSYYVIDKTNNQFQVTVTDSGAKVYKVSITPGTYSASNIVTQMNLDMTSNTTVVSGGGSATDLTVVYKMAVLVDATTSQMLFYQTVAAASGKPFAIAFPSTVNSVHEIIGFPGASTTDTFSSTAGVVYDNSSTAMNAGASTNYLYSPYFVQLSGPLYMILNSDLATGTDKTPVAFPNQNLAQQLDMIIVNSNYDGTITSGPSDKVSLRNSTSPISSCTFWFTLGTRTTFTTYDLAGADQATKYLSFNGGAFVVGVRFYQCARSVNTPQNNANTGDKMIHTVPTKDGSGSVPQERKIVGGVVLRPPPTTTHSRSKIPVLKRPRHK